MREYELEEVLNVIGLQRVKRHNGPKGTNFMFCCPFHGERKPSAGIVLDHNSAYGQCYSCKETFSIAKLVAHMNNTSIFEGVAWLQERYEVDFKNYEAAEDSLRRYEDALDGKEEKFYRCELPYFDLAPYRSGKETHSYFFDRGFNWNDVKTHMIGWDRKLQRITIPVFHADGVLCGFSGRAVLEQKIRNPEGRLVANAAYQRLYGDKPKYYIYDHFPISQVLYGSHNYFSSRPRKRAIIVEGLFDRIWMYKKGFPEALSIIVAKMSMDSKAGVSRQKEILHKLGVQEVVFMHDGDEAGEVGKAVAYKILKDDFICMDTKYPVKGYKYNPATMLLEPEYWKDPVGMSTQQIQRMLDNAWIYGKPKGRLKRYE